MATIMYKGDRVLKADPKRVQSLKRSGWTTKKGGSMTTEEKADAIIKAASEANPASHHPAPLPAVTADAAQPAAPVETGDQSAPVVPDFMGGELSEDEIRAKAKDAGIKNWYNKGLDKLKAELGI